jgi:hypothetical protein
MSSNPLDPILNIFQSTTNNQTPALQPPVNINDGGVAILTTSIAEVFADNSAMQILSPGVSQINEPSGSKKAPSLFIFPKSTVIISYKDNTTRTITNKSTKNDIIVVDMTNVINVTLNKIDTYENFEFTGQISFTQYDILMVILIILFIYFYQYII